MEWLLIPGLSLIGQLGAALIWWKTAGLILQVVILLGIFSIFLMFLWALIRVPLYTIGLAVVVVVTLVYVDLRHPTLIQKVQIPKGEWEVSARWKSLGKFDRYWVDRKLPEAWKPYEALVRIRVGSEDLYVVLKEGRVYVLGINLPVKSVEPLTGGR